jgi:hypothetical protein
MNMTWPRWNSNRVNWLLGAGWLLCSLAVQGQQLQDKSQRPIEVACPMTTSDLYDVEKHYAMGEFEKIGNRHDCLMALFAQTKPSLDPTVELQTVAERFMHLYALSNLQLYKRAEALEATTLLLLRFPSHKLDRNIDPPHFKFLLDSLLPYHANHFGVFAGGNRSFAGITDPIALHTDITVGGAKALGPIFRSRQGFLLGLEWQHHFGYQHSLVTGIGVQTLGFSTDSYSRYFDARDAADGDWYMRVDEHYGLIQLPLAYQYRLPIHQYGAKGPSWLGLQAGVYGQYLFQAGGEITALTWAPQDCDTCIRQKETHATIVSPLDRRVRWGAGLQAGLTFQTQLGAYSYYLRVSGQLGFTQWRARGTEYDESFLEFIWLYHLTDQNFRLHNVNVTLGLLIPKGNRVKNQHRL